ncbi:MAG: hypothetical protein RBG13Loki_3091 [Promethearchaeota archaeon CR_4]|nr:MAG: hypothetical protein RBG13Loki_3091 [Candidatus Lokiarchaeota archaeon CR_4]
MPHYKATAEIRHKFARPWGVLVPTVDGDKDLTARKVYELIREKCGGKSPLIIAIGDVVTDSFSAAGVPIQIAIIDGKTKRGFFSGKSGTFKASKTVDNPAGEITEQAWDVVREVITKNFSALISVNGEEDLLVVPAIVEAPKNSFILYGQPPTTDADPPIPEGVVFLEVTPEIKTKVKSLLKRFQTL